MATKELASYVGSTLDEASARLREERYTGMFEAIVESGALSQDAQTALAAQLDPKALANIDDLAEMMSDLGDFIDLMDAKIKRAQATRAKFASILNGLKSGVQTQMDLWTLRKVNGREHYFLLKKNPPSLEVGDASKIPTEFFDYEPVLKKQAIKDAIADGREVPECKINDGKFHLEIR